MPTPFSMPPVLVLAHPLTQPFHLPVSPVVTAGAATFLVLVAAVAWPARPRRASKTPQGRVTSWAGSLSRPQAAVRGVAVALLLLAIAAGRLGADDELDNLAPALVVGAAWPILVLASTIIGPVWRWLDPWDGIARSLSRDRDDEARHHVWPAALPALAWVWYLSAYPGTLEPRSIGTALALYTVMTLAGCLAVGRAQWLATAEPFGILLSWGALLPRGRLPGWRPPKGAEVVLGVLAGGALFGAVRRSELWGDLNVAPEAFLLSTLGVGVSCIAVAGLLFATRRVAGLEGGNAVVRGLVPAAAGIIVAVAMDSNRLTTSIQLLPRLFGDPFGLGWDPLGRAGTGLVPAPFGTTGLLVVQLGLLLAAHLIGAVVAAWSVPRAARAGAATVLSILAAASVFALVTH